LTVFLVRFRIGVLVSEDGVIGGSDLNVLETSITSFIALPLPCGVEIDISSSNGFFFFFLSTRKGACPEEKCSRVLVLGLRARFSRESPPGDSPAYRLDRRVVGIWNLIFIHSQMK
jgi:hypothetical protein